MTDRISRSEILKDALQEGVEVTATTVGRVTSIVTRAVGDVARAAGDYATEVFEIRDSARRALADQEGERELPED